MMGPVRDGIKQAVVSVITEIELLVRPIREERIDQIERIQAILDAPEVHLVALERPIARAAASIRARTGLALADAAIVATAIHTRCDVLVGNDERCAQRVHEIPYVFLDALVKEQRA